MDVLRQQYRVPEIYGAFWFNSDPIPLGALRGYVILIDFWDYSCQDCLRGLPYVQEWHRRYSDKGLVVIGVHTPQFPFGTDPINVRGALEKLNMKYPVVMDNDFLIWGAFRSTVWPSRYLIDKHGFIRYVQEGEGSYENFEHSIQSLITEAGYHDDLPIVMEPVRETDRAGAICYRATPQVLTGWQRGTIGNVEGFSPESTIRYEDPRYYLTGRLYLHGDWLMDRNSVRLRGSDDGEAHLVIVYQAKEVNAVIEPNGEKNFQVFVRQDDAYLGPSTMGSDVRIDEQGRSYLLIEEARLYNVVRNREYGEHKLTMTTRSNGFALYSLSFVSSALREMIPNN
jgi:thiol-disulfide isomerase/thioredoxin